jgi:hypothetical protein
MACPANLRRSPLPKLPDTEGVDVPAIGPSAGPRIRGGSDFCFPAQGGLRSFSGAASVIPIPVIDLAGDASRDAHDPRGR